MYITEEKTKKEKKKKKKKTQIIFSLKIYGPFVNHYYTSLRLKFELR